MSSKWLLPNATKDKQSITSDWNLTNLRLIQGVDVKEIKNVPKNNGSLVEVIRPEWLGENKAVAVDIETGEEYGWDDVLTFEPNILLEDKSTIIEAIIETPLLREAIFLFSKLCWGIYKVCQEN